LTAIQRIVCVGAGVLLLYPDLRLSGLGLGAGAALFATDALIRKCRVHNVGV